jgi:hypothetical protein
MPGRAEGEDLTNVADGAPPVSLGTAACVRQVCRKAGKRRGSYALRDTVLKDSQLATGLTT